MCRKGESLSLSLSLNNKLFHTVFLVGKYVSVVYGEFQSSMEVAIDLSNKTVGFYIPNNFLNDFVSFYVKSTQGIN